MSKTKIAVILLLSALALCGCAIPAAVKPVEVQSARLQPAPEEVMVPRPANFRTTLLDFFSVKPTEPTPSPSSLPPPKP